MFADNIILFTKANQSENHNLSRILAIYENDWPKESIKKVELHPRHISSKQPEESLNLGVPLTWGKQTIKWTRSTVEKITSKISSWRMNCISQVGRNCLLKFVTNVWQTILLTLPSSQNNLSEHQQNTSQILVGQTNQKILQMNQLE